MEHTLSDEAERAICTMLHHPDLCPDENVIPACNFDFGSCQECFSQKDFDQVINRKFNLLSVSELTSSSEGTISFIRGNSELLDEITNEGIRVGQHLEYDFNENSIGNQYSVVIDGEELNIPVEMANNIFIRV
jgi:DtxR family Mn-dependent transcriptional regulator